MLLLIDSAERAAIDTALSSGYIAGVTTNPTLLRRAGVAVSELQALAQYALKAGAGQLHMQVFATESEQMIAEGLKLAQIDPQRMFIKLPATAAGYRATSKLVAEGIRVTLTAVYTVPQILAAHSVGAQYAAIYIGRMRDAGIDALTLANTMQTTLNTYDSPMHILAASIRSPEDLSALALAGIGAATLNPALVTQLIESAETAKAAATFGEDAAALAA